MSLRDEHLQQALKHAPDRDMAPSDAVRKRVLDYAQSVKQSKRLSFLKRCVNMLSKWRVSSWQLVGMSTAASVLFVTVALRDQLPDEVAWMRADKQDVAETTVESGAANGVQQDKLRPQKELIPEPEANDGDVSLSERMVEPETEYRKESKKDRTKKSVPITKKPLRKLKEKIEKPVIDLADSAAPAPAPASRPVSIAAADQAGKDERAEAKNDTVVAEAEGAAQAKMEKSRVAAKTVETARKSAMPSVENTSGFALARQDIQARNFRILYDGNEWPENKLLFDEETGFRIEFVRNTGIQLPQEELTTYNQTMRDWYYANKKLAH